MLDTPEGLKAALKPHYEACPYLGLDGDRTKCLVHKRPEYQGSPCWTYGNPDVDPDFEVKRGRPCAVGQVVLEKGGLCRLFPQAAQPPLVQTLKVLGPWFTSTDDDTDEEPPR